MSKHGAVLLGQVRFFMCRAGVQSVRHIELSGLRVTPATAQRFATLQLRQQKHRSFASSASSADGGDGGKKQDKHIKETSPTSESNDKESSNDKTDKLKVGWEKCDDGNCDPSRFSKFPGYRVARKVRMFRQKQKHKKMVEAYQAYRDKINRENEILVKTQQRIIKAEKEAKERQEHEQHSDVSLEYVNGMPHLTVRLPSRNELCQFALKPISHNVGHLLAMLREEDRGIDRAAIINKHGVRIASSCTIERLLDDDFSIQINNRTLDVQPPVREKITVETIDKMGDVRKIIGQLYEAFNVGEYQLEKSNQLAKELETLRYELEPLEEKKMELAKKAERRTNMMTWVGLGLMSVQFGILARLTWWEYSWDIMEPVTYFVTYGTTMAMYAYYCVTKREYIMENVYNREYSLNIYRNAKKSQFDVEHYNRLKRRTAELEYNLSRLNDPINMQLPAHLVRTQLNTPPLDDDSGKSKKEKST